MICGSGELKSRLARAAGADPSGGMRDVELRAVVARNRFLSQNAKSIKRFRTLLEVEMMKKCTALWHEAHVEVKMHKAHHVRSTLGS